VSDLEVFREADAKLEAIKCKGSPRKSLAYIAGNLISGVASRKPTLCFGQETFAWSQKVTLIRCLKAVSIAGGSPYIRMTK
jgi:hypothetical protein